MNAETSCWQCHSIYPGSEPDCPDCGSTNANHDFQLAKTELSVVELQSELAATKLRLAEAEAREATMRTVVQDACDNSEEVIFGDGLAVAIPLEFMSAIEDVLSETPPEFELQVMLDAQPDSEALPATLTKQREQITQHFLNSRTWLDEAEHIAKEIRSLK